MPRVFVLVYEKVSHYGKPYGITYRTINNTWSKVSLLISLVYIPGKKMNLLSREKHPVTLIESADFKSGYPFEILLTSIFTVYL